VGQSDARDDHVVIVLCTYNGADYLQEQLDSYARQTHTNWSLWVSDDGSTDGTLAIIERFAKSHDVTLISGPQKGFAVNYMSALMHPNLPRFIVALSDQDDIWDNDKLERGVSALAKRTGPALYGAGSVHITTENIKIGASRRPPKTPEFRHALLQNAVSGHSAMMSVLAMDALRSAGMPKGIGYHDWWVYQLLSGHGASIILDAKPVLQYRQHAGNSLGQHSGIRARIKRLKSLLDGSSARLLHRHLRALEHASSTLTSENRYLLERYQTALELSGPQAALRIIRLGVYRQSPFETLVIWIAVALGRFKTASRD
jgi:hypothetical protein